MRTDKPERPTAALRHGLARAVRVVPVIAAILTLVAAAPASAATGPSPNISPVLDCVVAKPGGSYQAVFGYSSRESRAVTVPVGVFNSVLPVGANGGQGTTFEPGTHHGTFAAPVVGSNTRVLWVLGRGAVVAHAKSTPCGPPVTLPTEGNGAGPAIVLALSLLVSSALGVARGRRSRGRRS